MKKLLLVLSVIIFVQCKDTTKNVEITRLQDQLKAYQEKETLEKETREGIQKYITDLNAPDWRNRLENNNSGNKEEQKKFIAWYQEFRNAYQDMHMEIRHLAIDDDEAIMWARITAKHAGRTTDVIRNVSPAGKKVSWQEVWYFDMQKGIFGKKWDIFVRGLDKMQSVQSYTVPEDYFDSIN